MEHLQVRNVFHQRESGAYGESADGRVDHEGNPRRCNQKNPESAFGQFLHHGRPKMDVQILVSVEVPKNNCVDSVANGGCRRARRQRSPDRPQRHQFIAVQQTQRGQKHQHRQQRQGYPQRFVYPHRIAIRSAADMPNVRRFQPQSRR